MQVDALSDKIEKAPEKIVLPEDAAWGDPAWADSLGKSYAKGFGKGKGYGGKTAQPVDKAERICNCCGLKGHYARECVHWDKPSGKGGKSKGQIYEEKRLLSKGKGKGKKGKGKGKINSWEIEEDAYWEGSAEWATEEAASGKAESSGTVDAAALDCSLGSGMDDDFWPVLCLDCEESEQCFEEMAFIDGFESDSDEEDMSTLVSFLGPARRPHKSSPKFLPEQKKDSWSESDPWSEGRAQLVAPPGIDSPSSPLDLESAKKLLPKAAFMSADEFKAMTQSPTSDFGAVLAPRVPGSWADEVVADETTAHTCTTLFTSTSTSSPISSSTSISPTYSSSPEGRSRAVELHTGPTGLSEVGKLSLMMTAGAPTINPRCQGQGPKSKPTAGDDSEEDMATMYTSVAEARHASSACLDLSSCFTSYFHQAFHVPDHCFITKYQSQSLHSKSAICYGKRLMNIIFMTLKSKRMCFMTVPRSKCKRSRLKM